MYKVTITIIIGIIIAGNQKFPEVTNKIKVKITFED
jgi:hypothetical protein